MRSKILKGVYILVVAVLGFAVLNIGKFRPIPQNPVDLKTAGDTVSIISVGQANSALISSGGKYCLIDAAYTNEGHITPSNYLSNAGIGEIELLVITHFHADHTNEVIHILKNFKVNKIIIPNLSKDNMPTSEFFSTLLDIVEEKDISISVAKKGDGYAIGNGTVTVLDDTYNDLDINSTSIATLFRQGDFTFLNTADGEQEYEKRLMNVFNEKVNLFCAAHHGSKDSNSDNFIKVINPDFVAISAGKDNDYGHPHRRVTDLLENEHIPYGITFRDGSIVYSVTKNKLLT